MGPAVWNFLVLGIPIYPPARLGLRWPSMGTLSWTFRPLGHPTLLWSYGGAGASRQGWGKPPMLTPKKNAAMLGENEQGFGGGTKKGWEFVRKWRYFFEGLDSRWSIVMLMFFFLRWVGEGEAKLLQTSSKFGGFFVSFVWFLRTAPKQPCFKWMFG